MSIPGDLLKEHPQLSDWAILSAYRGFPGDLLKEHPQLSDWAILSAYRGSIVHGTYMGTKGPYSTDDKDAMVICVPPRDYYLGFNTHGLGKKGVKEIKRNEWDIVCYEARKAISLLEKGNPNMLMLLWLREEDYIRITPAGQLLLMHRSYFNGKHVYKSFVGYARGQMHRMTHGIHNGYMGFRRKELFAKHGYDVKNASHLIRLLRMAVEYLATGELNVWRHDASELIDIKRGRWTLEEIEKEAARLFELADKALIGSKLPERPSHKFISDLCVSIIEQAWAQQDYAVP